MSLREAHQAAAEQWRAAVPDLTDDELTVLQQLLGAEPHHLRRMAAIYRAGVAAGRVDGIRQANARPLVAAGPNPDMDDAWCRDLGEYVRMSEIAGKATDVGEAAALSEGADEYGYAVLGGLAERAARGDIPGMRA